MMRYLLIGLAVLAAVGTVCAVSGLMLERDMDEISGLLALSEERFRLGDLDGARERAEAARARFDARRPLFDATLPGASSAAAERKIDVLVRLLSTEPEDAGEAYSEAIEELRLISEGERLSLGNIL